MNIYTVVGVSTGVGTTTVAGNLAVIMQNTGNTLLIEASNKADILVPLGMSERFREGVYPTIADWQTGDLFKAPNGLAVLPGSERVRQLDNILLINDILNLYSSRFEHIIVDLGLLRTGIEYILANAITILVAEPSEKCLIKKSPPLTNFLLVVNKVSSKNICHPRDIERRFNVGSNQSMRIPEDIGAAKKAVQTRVPISMCGKKIGKAYEDIALALIGEKVHFGHRQMLNWVGNNTHPLGLVHNGRIGETNSISNSPKKSIFSFLGKKSLPEQNVIITTGDKLTETVQQIKKSKSPVVVIDADTGRLANMLGIDHNTSWKHDWRIGLAATPAKVDKKTEVFTLPEADDNILWEDRDFRALKEVVEAAVKKNKKVFIIASNDLYPMLIAQGF